MKISKLLSHITLLVFLIAGLIACERDSKHETFLKMKNSVWDRFDMKLFEIPVEDVSKKMDITFVIRVTDKFAYETLPLYVILTTPSGEERIREISLPINKNAEDPAVKIFESQIELWKDLTISETGKCKISVENVIPKIQVEGVEEIGIIVSSSKR